MMGSLPRKLRSMEKELQELGVSPEEAEKLSMKELLQKAMDYCDQGDAEIDAKVHKDAAIAQQREGEDQYIARLQPLKFISWVVSYTELGFIDPDTKQQQYCTSVCQNPEGLILGSKVTQGRPTVDEIITVLQVSMAFPITGKGRRPMSLLVAWRMRDMWPKLEKFLKEMEIHARLETREQAVIACAEHNTDIEGRNHPVPDEVSDEEITPADKLKDEGNGLFCSRQYAKAAEKYTEALEYDPTSAVLYSNRSIARLHMGLHVKALADAEEAIKLDPQCIKAHARKGLALEKLGRVSDARAHYQQCIKTLKNNTHFKDALQKLFDVQI